MFETNLLIILNFALYFIALIAIQYSATSNKLTLTILGPSFLVTLYLVYYCLSFMEEFFIRILWIIMVNSIWYMSILLTTPYTYTLSKFIKVDVPPEFIIRITKDMGKSRGCEVHVDYKSGSSYFIVNGFEVGVNVKGRADRSFVDFYVRPRYGLVYKIYLVVILLFAVPMSFAIYFENLLISLWGININVSFIVLLLIALTWYMSKINVRSLSNNLSVFYTDFSQRLKKVREAAKMLEAAKAAEELLRRKKKKMIEEAIKVAKAISIASEIKTKRTKTKYLKDKEEES